MENKKFTVLKECRTLFKVLHVTNKNGIYLDLYEISNWLFYSMFLLPQNLMLISCLWFVFDNGFNLTKIIWAATLSSALVQMQLTFLSLLSQKNLLNELLDRLQILINQSK